MPLLLATLGTGEAVIADASARLTVRTAADYRTQAAQRIDKVFVPATDG
jgi:hypothetical protein